jgi:hypothetical protein
MKENGGGVISSMMYLMYYKTFVNATMCLNPAQQEKNIGLHKAK